MTHESAPVPQAGPFEEAAFDQLKRAVEVMAGARFLGGHAIDVLHNGDEIFPAMIEAVNRASQSIDFVTFVYWQGDVAQRFAEAIGGAASRGVRVRVLLDSFGAAAMDQDLVDMLRESGCEVRWFRPRAQWKFWRTDHRTHRKILICDNLVGFTGGVGVADEWAGDARNPDEWRDTHFMIRGSAVDGLRAAFIADWVETGAPAVHQSDPMPSPDDSAGTAQIAVIDDPARIGLSRSAVLLEGLIQRARTSVKIQTPYFNPTPKLIDLMEAALRRGVAIEIVIPGPHIDKRVSAIAARSAYRSLVRAGADVYEFQPSMMHVKCFIIDDMLAFVGSVNMNERSFNKDEEVGVVISDDAVLATLLDHFRDDVERSELAEPARMSLRGIWERLTELALRPLRGEM